MFDTSNALIPVSIKLRDTLLISKLSFILNWKAPTDPEINRGFDEKSNPPHSQIADTRGFTVWRGATNPQY